MDKPEVRAKVFKACGIIFMICGAGFMALYITLIQVYSMTGVIAAGYIIAPLAVILYGFFLFRRSQKLRHEINEQQAKEGN